MIALVTSGKDSTPVAIHRTFLARDGVGKAPVNPPKMMLGPCRGGAVRLGEESRSRKSAQDDKWSFCLTAGTLCAANQERQ